MLMIRPAEPIDLPAVLDIYDDIIATSSAVYALAPVTLENRRGWHDERAAAG